MVIKELLKVYREQIALFIIGGLVVAGVVFLALNLFSAPSYFPHSVKKGVKFSLYYPVNPPAGLSVDQSSFKSPQSQVVTFTIKAGSSPKYYVSLEPVPNSFDPSVFQKNFIEVYAFHTGTGTALIGTLNSQLVGEVRTNDNTLILINTGDVNATSQLKALCYSFQKAN